MKAIKVHSDKNKAPNADEAFTKLSAANSVLGDQKAKIIYDKFMDIQAY